MNLCAHKHDEVCFEGSKCPLCAEIADRNAENESSAALEADLRRDIAFLEDGMAKLQSEIESLREPIVAAVRIANEENERTDHEKQIH